MAYIGKYRPENNIPVFDPCPDVMQSVAIIQHGTKDLKLKISVKNLKFEKHEDDVLFSFSISILRDTTFFAIFGKYCLNGR